jgi:hypothetical protein
MKTSRQLTTTAILFTALVFAGSLRAQTDLAPPTEPVLKAIPDNALGFVLIKNLGQTDKVIAKLAAMVQAPLPSVLSLFKSQAGIQEGLDENGSAAIALLPDKTAGTETAKPSPYPIVLFPVTDYKKFVSQFQPDDAGAEITGVTIVGRALIVGRKDSFAVFTLPDHKDQLARLIASTKGVDSLLGSMEPWIGRHQISFVATPTGSKMLFQAGAAAIKQAKAVFATLQNPQQTAQVVAVFDIYEKILTDAEKEVDSFGVGLALDGSSNLSIDSHTKFVASGKWAAAMKDSKPSEGNIFAEIQARPFVFAGGGIVPAEWAGALADLSASSMSQMNTASGGQAMDEQQRRKYVEAMRSMMKGIRSMAFVMASPKPGEGFLDGSVSMMKVDDTKEFLERYQKAIEQLSEISKGQKSSPFKFSDVNKIEIDGRTGLTITVDMSGMLAAMNNPASAKMMPLLFGPTGKMTMRIVAVDDRTLVAAYGSEEHAKEAVAEFKNPKPAFDSDPDVATTLKLLPPHAQGVGLVNIKGYMDFISGMVSAVAPAGAQVKLPEMPAMPPVGFAVEAGDGHLDTQMVLPVETIVGISKVVHHAISPTSRPAAN